MYLHAGMTCPNLAFNPIIEVELKKWNQKRKDRQIEFESLVLLFTVNSKEIFSPVYFYHFITFITHTDFIHLLPIHFCPSVSNLFFLNIFSIRYFSEYSSWHWSFVSSLPYVREYFEHSWVSQRSTLIFNTLTYSLEIKVYCITACIVHN